MKKEINLEKYNIGKEELVEKHVDVLKQWIDHMSNVNNKIRFAINVKTKARSTVKGGNKVMNAIAVISYTIFFFWKPSAILLATDKTILIVRKKNLGSYTKRLTLDKITKVELSQAFGNSKVYLWFDGPAASISCRVLVKEAQDILAKVS